MLSKSKIQFVLKPVSFRALASWAVVIFIVGFWHGRQLSELDKAANEPMIVSPKSATGPVAERGFDKVSSGPASHAAPVTVTIRMIKFAPETIEVGVGDVVEWSNKDLTPHTATSPPGSEPHEVDSGPINPGASWQHRFTKSGTFNYFCTFHSEMKGVVVVK